MSTFRGLYDLNKTLPLPPGIQEFSVKTETPDGSGEPATPMVSRFEDPEKPQNRVSRASTFHSNKTSSTSSSRGRSLYITRDLVASDSPKVPNYSPINLPSPNSAEPVKYDPTSEADEDSISPITLHNQFKKLNGWSPLPNSASEGKDFPLCATSTSPHIPQSHSEGYIDQRTRHLNDRSAQYYIPPYLLPKRSSTEISKVNRSLQSDSRGRAESNDKTDENQPAKENRKNIFDWPLSTRKRSRSPHKRLFGENGWLSRSNSRKNMGTYRPSHEQNGESAKKVGSRIRGEKTKQVPEATDMLQEKTRKDSAELKEPKIEFHRSNRPVSVVSMDQMMIYSESELLIVTQVNRFLLEQHQKGRISAESVAKVMKWWREKNRPQVLEFMFDQTTQRDIILYNIKTLQFGGKYQHSNVKLSGVLSQWKALAKDMNVRTFCNPDTMIKQDLLVVRKICDLVNACPESYTALRQLDELVKQGIKDAETKRKDRTVLLGTPRVVDIPFSSPTASPYDQNEGNDVHKGPFEE